MKRLQDELAQALLDEAAAKDMYEIAYSAKKGEIDDATKDLNAAKAAVSSANAVIAELELTQASYPEYELKIAADTKAVADAEAAVAADKQKAENAEKKLRDELAKLETALKADIISAEAAAQTAGDLAAEKKKALDKLESDRTRSGIAGSAMALKVKLGAEGRKMFTQNEELTKFSTEYNYKIDKYFLLREELAALGDCPPLDTQLDSLV